MLSLNISGPVGDRKLARRRSAQATGAMVAQPAYGRPVNSPLRRAAAEAIGTFFLVLIGPGAVMVNALSDGRLGPTGIALAFAFVVTAMIFAFGHLSGAHINPAVTIAFWSVRRFPAREVAPYIAAQCIGALGASATLYFVMGPIGQMGATLPAVGLARSLAVEWLFSFVLMLVIMAVATDERVPGGFGGIAVGMTVGFCALLGELTGSSMNPARSLGPAAISGLWSGHWIYWVAPVTGMATAAWTYNGIRPVSSPNLTSLISGVEGPVD